jgi:hypothetical protein
VNSRKYLDSQERYPSREKVSSIFHKAPTVAGSIVEQDQVAHGGPCPQ